MIIFPALDLYGGQAVRLYKGDYDKVKVYDVEPIRTAVQFELEGATHLHLVDLEGAKKGKTSQLQVIWNIVHNSKLFVEVGGGIRTLQSVENYLNAGASRVILGTAAVERPDFAKDAVEEFGDRVAVGVDIKDDKVAIHGWTETSSFTCDEFCQRMQDAGVQTIICTDVSRDGAMGGANIPLYRRLSTQFMMDIIASGGISSLKEIRALREIGMHGAIIGKAYYEGSIRLADALRHAAGNVSSAE